jgi:phosphoribosyl 1,2-cyclic phosphodiesterase
VSIKAIIWGSCGSLPTPASSATIREKVKDALWAARAVKFTHEGDVESFIDTLPHCTRGTYKANTSCVQIEAGTDDVILCDSGTGIRDYALSLPADTPPRTYHIFISHLHWDHIQGFPFFTPAYIPGNKIVFHGFHKEIEAVLRRQMDTPTFPVSFDIMAADIEFDIRECGASFQIGDVSVTTIKQQHPGDSWGYRFEQDGKSIIFSSDSEHGPEAQEEGYRFVNFFRNADVLIFDGQYTFADATTAKRDWGHSDHITAIELAARAQVKQLTVFHHEPAHSDQMIEKMHMGALQYLRTYNQKNYPGADTFFPNSLALAYDGLVIEA